MYVASWNPGRRAPGIAPGRQTCRSTLALAQGASR
jgi:hypothetical protein